MLKVGPKTDRPERELQGELPPFSFRYVIAKKAMAAIVITFFFFSIAMNKTFLVLL